ncbi:MAG: hypothetical protein EBU01_05680, partial [Crocinitomicaceae bacterium]|nr:hypothetical protein [Crocinitomicaceae bacterium]
MPLFRTLVFAVLTIVYILLLTVPFFGNSYTYLGFNLKHRPFDDIRVRQAI